MKVFEKIRSARELKNWSQEVMAEKLEMSPSGYAKIERGETQISLPRLEQISQILEISIVDLLSNEQGDVIYQINDGDNNTGINFFANSNESLQREIEKLQLIIEHQKQIIEHKEREISIQKDLIELFKTKQN